MVMPMLQFVKRDVRPSGPTCVLSQGDIKAAQKSISKAIDMASDKSHQHGKYNSYSPEQRARIGKYAAENGATCEAFFSSLGYFYNRIYGKEASPKEFLLQHHGLLRQSIVTRLCYLNQWLGYHPFILSS